MASWLNKNKSWIFSGIGVAIILLILNQIRSCSRELAMDTTNKLQECPKEKHSKNLLESELFYSDWEIKDGSYLWDAQEVYRAVILYRDAIKIDYKLMSEVQSIIEAQKKRINELESLPTDSLTIDKIGQLENLRRNLKAFELLKAKLEQTITLYQNNIAEISSISDTTKTK